jgi:hypothetical protein
VTPISPAAQKFHLLILCIALDNSVTVADSSMPALMLGKRHIADMNQNTAEPHAVTITAVSMYDLITAPEQRLQCQLASKIGALHIFPNDTEATLVSALS